MGLLPLKVACELIHKAIHSVDTYVSIAGERYPVIIAPNGCRCILYNKIHFMEQNKTKTSIYAKRALAGEPITWGIIPNGSWILIDKDGVHLPPLLKADITNIVTLTQ